MEPASRTLLKAIHGPGQADLTGWVQVLRRGRTNERRSWVGYVPQREIRGLGLPDLRASTSSPWGSTVSSAGSAGPQGTREHKRALVSVSTTSASASARRPPDQPAFRRTATARLPRPRARPGTPASTSWTNRSPASTRPPSGRSSACSRICVQRGHAPWWQCTTTCTPSREYFDHVVLLNMRLVAAGPGGRRPSPQENLQRTYGGRLTVLTQATEDLASFTGPRRRSRRLQAPAAWICRSDD